MMLHDQQFISFAEATAPLFVGVGVAETGLTVGVLDDRGLPLSWGVVLPGTLDCLEDVLRRAHKAVAEVMRQADAPAGAVARVGLALPGTVDSFFGKLTDVADPSDDGKKSLCERSAAVCKLPVSLANNAVAAAFGESWVGAGRSLSSLVLLMLDARIGCGVIFGDASIDGLGSHGVDAAHMIIQYGPQAPLCPCGQRGHLQAYLSPDAVTDRVRQSLAGGRASPLAGRLDQGQAATLDLLAQGANAGDPVSLEIIAEMARYLAVGIVNLMNTLDPDGVLLSGAMTFGGSSTPLGRQFLQWVKEEVARRAFAALAEHTIIDFATLGPDAVCYGAAGIARADHRRRTARR